MKIADCVRLTVLVGLVATFPRPAHAYLDPSTGGMLVSALISVVVTGGLAIQAYWHKLVGVFRGDEAETEKPLPSQADPGANPSPESESAP